MKILTIAVQEVDDVRCVNIPLVALPATKENLELYSIENQLIIESILRNIGSNWKGKEDAQLIACYDIFRDDQWKPVFDALVDIQYLPTKLSEIRVEQIELLA